MTTNAHSSQPDQSSPVQPLPPARKVSAVVIGLWRFVRRLSAFAWREELARAEAGYQCYVRNATKERERLVADKWRYRLALEEIIKLGEKMPEDAEEVRIAKAALFSPNISSQRTRHPMPDHQQTEAPTQEQRPGSL